MKYAATIAVASAAIGGVAADGLVARASSTSSGSSSIQTITIKGNAFFQGDNRFYLRGVDYQPGGSSNIVDPLADYSSCSRDIAEFQKLGINTIRVYTVDNSQNHDQCMNALAAAGIYLALDVNNPKYSLNRADPGPTYNAPYLQSIFATIDVFAKYDNLLLFFSGNEDINDQNTTISAPFVKAVTRDMRQYIAERGYRSIPVGYAAADVSQNQYLMAQYMDCGEAPSRSDFYAINNYEWCSPSSFTQSGWSNLVSQYSNYSLPLFFSEYGCIKNNARDFSEVSALYNTEMTSVFSGGLVYEYSNEGNGWGLVTINGDSVTDVTTTAGDQFTLLQQALANNPPPSNGGGYTTTNNTQECPPQSDNWNTSPFTGSALPAMPSGAVQYLKNGAGTPPGLTGDGSMNAGGGSTSTASPNAGAATATYATGTATGKSAAAPMFARPFHSGMASVGMAVVVFVSFGLGAALI